MVISSYWPGLMYTSFILTLKTFDNASTLIKACDSVNVTQILLHLLVFCHENLLNLFYFDVQGMDVTFQPAVLCLQPTLLQIICGLKQKNDTRPFFTLAFTVPNKRHAAQAALQIWDKAIGQLFASYHFPLNNKERDTKKVSEEGILFCLAHSASLFSAPGRQKAVHYIQSRGHFFIDRNNGISYCSGAPVIQVEFIQEVCWGSWRMKERSPCQSGREQWMEEEGKGGGIGGSPWAPLLFGGGELLSLYFSLPVSARSHQPSSRWSPQAESRMESIRSLWCPFRPCALTRLLHACHT